MTTFIKDSQSRITRYGIKCFQLNNGIKCYAFAPAKKIGKKLIISDLHSDLINANGESIHGEYLIKSIDNGKIANVICEKLN